MPATKKTPASKYNANAAPELVYQLSRASQGGLPAGDYLKLAEKRGELHAAIIAYCPAAIGSPRKFADALRPLVGKAVDYCGEKLTLKSRYVNRRHETQFCVDGTLRHKIMKARAVANDREAKISATAHVLAVELRKHGDPVAAVAAVLPTIATPAEPRPAPAGYFSGLNAREQSLEETRRWERRDSLSTASKLAPVVLEESAPAPLPPPVADTTARRPGESMPDWIQRTGIRPSYHTRTWETPDPSFKNAELRGCKSGPEIFDFSISDAEREARKPKRWSPFG